jgi:hypothetical protein
MRMAIAPGIHVLSMMNSGFLPTRAARLTDLLCCLVGFLLLCSISALAHDHHAPPARIITDEQVGPWTISVWAQQHMDTGTFFVKVRPSSGTTVPTLADDLKVEIGVQPANQNSPEIFYAASRESQDEQYEAEAPFDIEKSWQIRVRLQSSRGINETTTYIGASPPGSGQWQLLLYSLPFLSVGALWLQVYRLRRGLKHSLAPGRDTALSSASPSGNRAI